MSKIYERRCRSGVESSRFDSRLGSDLQGPNTDFSHQVMRVRYAVVLIISTYLDAQLGPDNVLVRNLRAPRNAMASMITAR